MKSITTTGKDNKGNDICKLFIRIYITIKKMIVIQPELKLLAQGCKTYEGFNYSWMEFTTGDDHLRFVVVEMPDGFLKEVFYDPYKLELKKVLERLIN